MRILGLDIGTKRIGVAITDELGIIAQPLETVDSVNIQRIMDLIEEYKVGELVVGLPLNMDGSQGPKAKEVIALVDSIKKKLSIPVKMWDERLTTVEVERHLIGADVSRKKRKKSIDKLAAQLILRSYLDSKDKNV